MSQGRRGLVLAAAGAAVAEQRDALRADAASVPRIARGPRLVWEVGGGFDQLSCHEAAGPMCLLASAHPARVPRRPALPCPPPCPPLSHVRGLNVLGHVSMIELGLPRIGMGPPMIGLTL